MTMADGAPLTHPRGYRPQPKIVYVINVTKGIEGEGPMVPTGIGFDNADAASDFVGADTRYEMVPLKVFETAAAAKSYTNTQARKDALAKLTPADMLALGIDPAEQTAQPKTRPARRGHRSE